MGWSSRWTPAGARIRTSYDAERRPIARRERLEDGSERTIERMVYGEELPVDEAKAANLLGTLVASYDSAGALTIEARTFESEIAASERRLLQDPATTPDWPDAPLAVGAFATTFAYDAMRRVVRTTTADGTIIHRAYDLRGNLDRVTEGEAGTHVLLEAIDYNARGQRVSVRRGNGTRTAHGYDPYAFRLKSTWSGKLDGSGVLQDLTYTYDPVGNVVRQVDDAQPVAFYANAKVEPAQTFRNDSAYRLIEAKGREQVVPGKGGAPGPNGMPATKLPATALRNYLRRYSYDAIGNLTAMPHLSGGLGWDLDDRLRRSDRGAGQVTS